MWTLTCPFDAPFGDNPPPPKTKLLKPNRTYGLGRKNQPLIVTQKRISGDHCSFVVGEFSVDDVLDPTKRPPLVLQVSQGRTKGLSVTRNDTPLTVVGPGESLDLKDGDVISLLTDILVNVEWRSVVAYASGARAKPSVTLEECADLGVHLLPSPHPLVTHHLTPIYAANLSLAPSLLSLSHFVKPEWLSELIKIGRPDEEDEGKQSTLEREFVLPAESKYRPSFSPSLSPDHKTFGIWGPNEERVHLFRDFRFICFTEKGTINETDLRQTIERGDGTWEAFDVHAGPGKFQGALSRSNAKAGKTTVLVADVDAMQAAVGEAHWQQYRDEARRYNLDFHSPQDVVLCVINATVAPLKPTGETQSQSETNPAREVSAPPEPVPEPEPAQSPPPESPKPAKRKLVRRAASRGNSVAPPAPSPPPEPETQPQTRRKPLVRRAGNQQSLITGLDDPSAILDAPPLPPPPTDATPTGLTPATPSRPKLKRRAGTANPSAQLSLLGETIPEEPPLKKWKALFEESGADPMETQATDSTRGTQTLEETQFPATMDCVPSSITNLREEEEEETQATLPRRRALKRALAPHREELRESYVPDEGEEDEPPRKRRSIEPGNSVEPSRPSAPPDDAPAARPAAQAKVGYTTWTKASAQAHAEAIAAEVKEQKEQKRGAAPGKPDTDDAFLKAIASTKRGKKTEDDFDREFNKLKIAKPVVQEPDPEEQWAILKDFGDDTNLRGNFMVIVDMEVPGAKRRPAPPPDPSWDGKPNFKKFKKKIPTDRTNRPKVNLVPTGDPVPPPSGKTKRPKSKPTERQTSAAAASQPIDVDMDFPDTQNPESLAMESQPEVRGTKRGREAAGMDVDPGEDAPIRKTRRAPSRAPSAAPPAATAGTRSKKPASSSSQAKPPSSRRTTTKTTDLFIEDSDPEEAQASNPKGKGRAATRSNGAGMGTIEEDVELTLRSNPAGGAKAPAKKAAAPAPKRASRATKKLPPVLAESDSDDAELFGGFRGAAATPKKGR